MQLKLIGIVLAALALIGLLAHDHYLGKRLKTVKAEKAVLEATIETERENTRKANEASAKYQGDLAQLRASRTDNPLPAVVCKRPRLPSTSPAPSGSDVARPADDPPEDEGDRDIGPQLDDFATACEANLSQLTRLQEWVRSR